MIYQRIWHDEIYYLLIYMEKDFNQNVENHIDIHKE